MTEKKMSKKWLAPAILLAVFMTGLNYCVPPEQSQEEMLALQRAKRDSMRKANYNKCAFKLSNADQYKIQENWNNAIMNYQDVVELGCAEDFFDPLFEDMAYCYFKRGDVDSAAWSVREGLIYNNTDRHMLNLLTYYLRSKPEERLQAYVQITTLYPDDKDALFEMADVYNQLGDVDNQIETLDKVLNLDPGNTKAEQQIVAAYESSGRDPLERIASAWENDKMNATNAYRYGKMLFDRGDTQRALEVLKEASTMHSGNRSIMELLAQTYEYEFRMDQALAVYQDLANRYSTDQELTLKVVKLLLDSQKYQEALAVSEKAIATTIQNGKAVAARGDVYYAVAQSCSGMKKNLDFNDKLVFHMAYEDYNEAVKQGNSMVGSKLNYLKNPNNAMIIGSKSDYFLASEANKISAKTFKVLGDCYSWIKRTVTVD